MCDDEQSRVAIALNAVQNAILQQTIRLANARKHANTPASLLVLNKLETQLLREYSRLIRLRAHADDKFNGGRPSREKCCAFISWLQVVNVSAEAAQSLGGCIQELNQIMDLKDSDLNVICDKFKLEDKDRRKFVVATSNLRKYTRRWKERSSEPMDEFSELDLCWGGLDVEECRRTFSESGLDSGAYDSGVGSNVSQNSLPTTTPPPSPGFAMAYVSASGRSMPGGNLLGVTHLQQAPRGKHKGEKQDSYRAAIASTSSRASESTATPPSLHKFKPPPPQEMTRSKSEEANLAIRIQKPAANKPMLKPAQLNVSRSMHESLTAIGTEDSWSSNSWSNAWLDESTFMSPTSPMQHSDKDSPFFDSVDLRSPSASISVPRSPNPMPRFNHHIPHQWYSKKISMSNCYVCKRSLGVKGEKCKSCKVKVHTDCKLQLGVDTCGLTKDHVKRIINIMFPSNDIPSIWSPNGDREPRVPVSKSEISGFSDYLCPGYTSPGGYNDLAGGSSSSTNSSAPQTPANTEGPHPSSASLKQHMKFTFPGVEETPEVPVIVESDPNGDDLATHNSNFQNQLVASTGSDLTVTGHESQGGCSAGTGSTLSQDDVNELVNSLSSCGQNEDDHLSIFQRVPTLRGQTTSWKEVIIKYDEIKFPKDSMIGVGRFGEVHRGYWHQDVAVKVLNMDHIQDKLKQVEAFKKEVVSFKNTRHENLVLFLGYCLDLPKLAIVMNLCKGKTLHSIIHNGLDRMDSNKIMNVAIQIVQGMSYLHQKNILHKDLRSKNIFVELNHKVVITDFGLFSMQRLKNLGENRKHSVRVPEYWLCYVAPEIMRLLNFVQDDHVHMAFSTASDVYAFGTVWYELISREHPFNRQTPDCIVWQVGRGIKPPLSNILMPKEMKEILMQCWAFTPSDRPDFNEIGKILERLPRKRLARSPSHPVSMSRSAEAIF